MTAVGFSCVPVSNDSQKHFVFRQLFRDHETLIHPMLQGQNEKALYTPYTSEGPIRITLPCDLQSQRSKLRGGGGGGGGLRSFEQLSSGNLYMQPTCNYGLDLIP